MPLLVTLPSSVAAAMANPTAILFLEDEGAPSGPLYQVAGLPVHPLVVHLAVVMLPLAALGLFAIFFSKRLRKSLGWLVLLGLAVGVGGTLLAKESGEQLAAAIGLPARHAELAEQMTIMSLVLLGVAVLWYVAARLADRKEPSGSPIATVLGIIMLVVATITLIWTVLVGHSGAVSVWEGRLPDASATPTPSASPTASPSATASASGSPSASATPSASPTTPTASYTLAQVAAHATEADCWAAVDGSVYDLTGWIAAHPGGAGVIRQMCGTDATAAFRDEHGTSGEPNAQLEMFRIGALSAQTSPDASAVGSGTPTTTTSGEAN